MKLFYTPVERMLRVTSRDRIAWYCARLEIVFPLDSGVQISLSALF